MQRPAPTARILLHDRDPFVLASLAEVLEAAGYAVTCADGSAQAIQCLRAGRFALVVTDADPPGDPPLALLGYIRSHDPDLDVIVTSACGTIAGAVEAMRQGACDYLPKPLRSDRVLAVVRHVLCQRELQSRTPRACPGLGGIGFEDIVGRDAGMAGVFDLIVKVADSSATVLVTGESGTGKSLVARAIHAHSPRQSGPFVEVACGALPDTLLESELFGHVRGAFTGAVADKPGKFAGADGGTLFLDEVATASPQLQIKLLRVLQERQFEPVGSNETRTVDVRVVLATNRDLWAEVEAGRFRQDLYYRADVVHIELPPLRDRTEDIPLLARHFLDRQTTGPKRRVLGFSAEAMELMQRHAWPGNVRELENCVEHASVLSRGAFVAVDDLPPAVVSGVVRGRAEAGTNQSAGRIGPLKDEMAEPERQILLAALRANGGNRQRAAAQLGINRTTLYKKMKRLGLMG